MSITRIRAERLVDERARTEQNIEDMRAAAEGDNARDLNELEVEQIEKWRQRITDLDTEISVLTEDLEREANTRDVSKLIRVVSEPAQVVESIREGGPVVYRTFAAYAQDKLTSEYELLATRAAADRGTDPVTVRQQSIERLQRALEHTLSSDVPGLVPPQHMAQIMDLINSKRPVVSTARSVDLSRGKLTYPVISQRPEVIKQGTEKTLGGSVGMAVDLDDITADTYIGGGNLSWQTINWSTPDALQLWFDLAAEAYAQATETAACTEIASAGPGTASPVLGTAGTETLAQWRAAVLGAVGAVYSNTSGRAQTNTLYLSADQFFYLAALATDAVVQMSPVGNLDIAGMTGTFSGLRVVGSYGFAGNTRIIGDSNAFLYGENPGAPVELRAVEPSIGGMEVGIIGAFQSKVFDDDRFLFLSAHL